MVALVAFVVKRDAVSNRACDGSYCGVEEPRMTDREHTLTMLRNALKLEEKGALHYADLAEQCANEMSRRLLKALAEDEKTHAAQLRLIWDRVAGDEPWPNPTELAEATAQVVRDFYAELKAAHAERLTDEVSDVDAVDLGIDHAQRSLAFYRAQLDEADEPLAINFLQAMVREETKHLEALQRLHELFAEPERW